MKTIHIEKSNGKYWYTPTTMGDGFAKQVGPFSEVSEFKGHLKGFRFTDKDIAHAIKQADETGNAELVAGGVVL
jgi:hypothetical protein